MEEYRYDNQSDYGYNDQGLAKEHIKNWKLRYKRMKLYNKVTR